MTNFVQVIKKCEEAGGAGSKKVIQAALAEADTYAKALIKAALDPYKTYGVRQYDEPTKFQQPAAMGVGQFLNLLEELAPRRISGDAARAAVTRTLELYDEELASYLARVLDKDLRCGFSAETANKVWGEKVIPTFEVMLADKCESPEEFLEKITFPCQADFKYDGQRTIAIVTKNSVDYRARSGKPSEHLNGLFDFDLLKIRDLLGYDFVMDGEAFASDFTETMNAKKTGNDAAKQNLRLRAFFMMPLVDWIRQTTKITMRHNRFFLEEVLRKVEATKVIISEGREVTSYEDMVSFCNEAIDKHGQEGLILKNWDATYQWDRTMDWCKVKRFYDVDARVVGWYKGRKNSRLENTCGGLVVEGRDERDTLFRTNVGSGFSDEQRDHIAKNFDEIYAGSTAVITYQEMTLAKGETIHSLRFPVVKQLLRDDKVVPALEV